MKYLPALVPCGSYSHCLTDGVNRLPASTCTYTLSYKETLNVWQMALIVRGYLHVEVLSPITEHPLNFQQACSTC